MFGIFKKQPTQEELGKILGPVAEKYNIPRIYLFGSRARGDNRPDSDYDIVIDVNSWDFSVWDFFDCQEDLEQTLGKNVDLVALDDIYGKFRERVLNEMVLAYG